MASKNLEAYQRMCENGEFERDITSERSRNAMLEAFTPDFVIVVPSSLPQGGVWEGRDEWLKMNAKMRELWESKNIPQAMWDVPEDDLVVLYSRKEWTARSTGKTVEFPAVELLHFRDAKICKVEMFLQDTKVILDALE
jgi:ketosteroid isomerase-like protein